MRSQEDWKELSARVVARFGRLVVESALPRRIGEVLRSVNVSYTSTDKADQPLVVVAEATREAWVEQCEFAGSGSWVSRPVNLMHYYYVETD